MFDNGFKPKIYNLLYKKVQTSNKRSQKLALHKMQSLSQELSISIPAFIFRRYLHQIQLYFLRVEEIKTKYNRSQFTITRILRKFSYPDTCCDVINQDAQLLTTQSLIHKYSQQPSQTNIWTVHIGIVSNHQNKEQHLQNVTIRRKNQLVERELYRYGLTWNPQKMICRAKFLRCCFSLKQFTTFGTLILYKWY
ncbi:unnamed protein product [Paramecium octaurelia]|uniref:Uncharacterized protein n=1 Tax=Paramecium octaurelia TaxID=43137 RepID=A0A8S1YM53_PAROT|nr:unnamed protein product [Paramecium octaurelia]